MDECFMTGAVPIDYLNSINEAIKTCLMLA